MDKKSLEIPIVVVSEFGKGYWNTKKNKEGIQSCIFCIVVKSKKN